MYAIRSYYDQLSPGSAAYNIPMAVQLEGDLDRGALKRALNMLVSRHESLRTRFGVHEGQPHQLIEQPPELALEPFDLSAVPDPKRKVLALAREEVV